ncbi:hypothetical protein TVAG_107690 [Trichomonas vaginalis G3]|uniref:Leucine Rich Repeat family protein n=1 Tax=Trichomonas vaginalis (strain ATCC PRA-98 / G3) TaxID=412133 RepID=A2F0R5_TRIV3|nr:leucine-rich repeat, isoform f-related family [Trichomonas vaginalis G3]EAY01510.1 hypothetical protein TVAG_107690 [Trichomonas vaginalis G3]KAI5482186.1 leucine-rich repeat, isoform f-related family [Trichomonas vaginalis G3]|eukprot:XP_001314195.1 hypothetical protein [Trichomonas vaginalis G3]
MENELENFIWSMSPNLKRGTAHVLYYGNVHWISSTNCTQERIFVVSTNGIFLGRRKALGMSEVTTQMSYFDMISISIGGTSCNISSQTEQIRIRADNIEQIALLIYFVRQAQFSPSLLPISFNFQNSGSYNMKTTAKSYKSRHVFADRIGSCALHYGIELFPEEMSVFYTNDSLPYHNFEINNAISNFMLIKPLALALTFEQDLHKFILYKCNVAKIFQICYSIFACNQFLERIIFNDCDFTNAAQTVNSLFDKATFLPVTWCFKNCDCSSPAFISFFENLTDHSKRVKGLEFVNTTLTSQSLMTIIQTILFNNCFHNLECLEISKLTGIPDIHLMINSIANSSWALTSKCIKRIEVSKSNTDISQLFMNIVSFDIGLTEICLSGNKFMQPLGFERIPSKIGFLDLSDCTFTLDSITSIFNAISNGKICVSGIDLSRIHMDPNDFSKLLELLAAERNGYKSLERIFFDNNVMNPKDSQLFATFLRFNTQLRSLSISQSINIYESSQGFRAFSFAICQLKNLESLYIRGCSDFSYCYGQLLIPVLRYLASKKRIKVLDITDQRIGDVGIDALMIFLQKGQPLIHLKFDGCHSSSFDKLSNFCHLAISSHLIFASWPEEEFMRHINQIPKYDTDRGTLVAEKEMLKSTYVERFGYLCIENQNSLPILKKEKIKEFEDIQQIVTVNEKKENDEKDMKKYSEKFKELNLNVRDNQISTLMTECLGQSFNDPVLSLLASIDRTFSLDNIQD